MPSQPKTRYSFEDWLAAERSDVDARHEYVAGEVFAMTGASESHNVIVANITTALTLQMRGRPHCRVYASDMKVHIEAGDAGKYPDLLALCGERRFHDGRRDVLLNPSLIVEVLSDSTEAYDRGEKFALYRLLESLREYLLVSQNRMRVELYLRRPDGSWLLTDYTAPDARVPLPSIDCVLPLAEIYDKVDLPAG